HRSASSDPGFHPRGVELASLDLAQAGYTKTTGPLFARELVDRVRELSDVQSVTVATSVPGGFEVRREALAVPGVQPPNGRFFTVDSNVVDPGFFATLRTPISAAQDFTPDDRAGTQPGVVVSDSPARQFWPGQDAVGKYRSRPRVRASAAGGLGIVAVLLAAIGVYGVTEYAVARRTREIGIRIALGARRTDVVRMVLQEGLSLTLIGDGVGLTHAGDTSHVLAAFLFGIPPIDPVTFTGTTLLFVAIGVAACYVPIRLATRIDAMEALRYE